MRGFNIRSLMIVIALAAVPLCAARLDPILGYLILGCMSMVGLCWALSRAWPNASPWLMVVWSLLGLVPCVWLCVWHYEFATPMLIALVSLLASTLCLVSGIYWVRSRKGRQRPSVNQARVVLTVLCALLGSMALIPWPLYVAFALSKPALERLADRVAAGESVTGPEWAGVYQIVGSRTDSSGNVALLLDANPNGPIGFVRMTNSQERPLVLPTDLCVPLTPSWSYNSED
jgi:hypothetical protein